MARMSSASGGRPQGEARQRLVAAIAAMHAHGQADDYEGLAMRTGLPCSLVRRTLAELRRADVADVRGHVPSPSRRRPRALYGAGPVLLGVFDEPCPGARLAGVLCHAWR